MRSTLHKFFFSKESHMQHRQETVIPEGTTCLGFLQESIVRLTLGNQAAGEPGIAPGGPPELQL